MSKIITKKEYVEIPKEIYEELQLAVTKANLASDYTKIAFDSETREDYCVLRLTSMINDIRDIVSHVADQAAECKGKIRREVSIHPKETLADISEKIPIEIRRRKKEA